MSESKQQLIAEKERVWDQDGELVATVWARRPDDTRLPGESWVDMRMRIGPALDAAAQETISRARQFAAAPELVEAAKKLVDMYDAHFSLTDYSAFEISKHYVDELADAFEAARAALAKAGA
ncbi:hypothetical protein [Burkholderia glumae]|uniref:hypothetical protein n=1 Tax=Burkholderia glumae TaxID=337 RepID=UPI00214FA52A|nr:hypothetical protein [Burkholderia glumae]